MHLSATVVSDFHTSVVMRSIHADGGYVWDRRYVWDSTPWIYVCLEGIVHGLALDGDSPPIHCPTALLVLVRHSEEVSVAGAKLRLHAGDGPVQVLSVCSGACHVSCQLPGRGCSGMVTIQATRMLVVEP